MLAELIVVRARRVLAGPIFVRARRILAEPMVVRARLGFVEPEVCARCMPTVCYGHAALGVWLCNLLPSFR